MILLLEQFSDVQNVRTEFIGQILLLVVTIVNIIIVECLRKVLKDFFEFDLCLASTNLKPLKA